jgi:hypothetical protein
VFGDVADLALGHFGDGGFFARGGGWEDDDVALPAFIEAGKFEGGF